MERRISCVSVRNLLTERGGKGTFGKVPGGLVIRIPGFYCHLPKLNPWQENWDSTSCIAKKKKRKGPTHEKMAVLAHPLKSGTVGKTHSYNQWRQRKENAKRNICKDGQELEPGVVLSKAGDPVPQSDIQPMTLKSATTSGAPGPLGEHWTHI